jgi:hypothetical protein
MSASLYLTSQCCGATSVCRRWQCRLACADRVVLLCPGSHVQKQQQEDGTSTAAALEWAAAASGDTSAAAGGGGGDDGEEGEVEEGEAMQGQEGPGARRLGNLCCRHAPQLEARRAGFFLGGGVCACCKAMWNFT